MPELPTGTVTFLFTDIEGSTRLWETHPHGMRRALARHDALAADIVARHDGVLVKPRGEGDSLFCVFDRATDALTAACALQRALLAEPWHDYAKAEGERQKTPAVFSLRVRMALHTGEANQRDGDYYGPAINRCARLRAIGHGGQVLLSGVTFDLVRDHLPPRVTLEDRGQHGLKDLERRPEQVYQVRHPDLPAEFPPLKSQNNLPNNLPMQVTSFVGRDREMAEIKRHLVHSRLVTLTGSGGTGKTRLSLQVAADLLDAFRDGAWLVELAPLSEPNLVPQTAATALGVREEPGRAIAQTLIDYLRDKTLLLVLDNCEHVLDAAAQLTHAVLTGDSGVRILASSREALGIAGEQTYRVPSLSVPDPNQRPSLESLSQYVAVRLLIDRALLSQPAFTVTNNNAPAVAQICFRLDGIPLAIELAAARVKAMPVEKIAERLDDRFRLLTGGSRTALPRHQTLRASIDWSYDLLDEKEKVLLRRLSVFAGGWTLETAEKVCSDPTEQNGT
jgi:class 3 adenylate cyclase